MKRILIVGGSKGIGLGIATVLAEREEVEDIYILSKTPVEEEFQNPKFRWYEDDLNSYYHFFDRFDDVDAVIVTAGFGELKLFKDIPSEKIEEYFRVNTFPTMKLVHQYYDKLEGGDDFYFCVLGSIAGFMSSPYFSIYGATKAALKIFIESVNVELRKGGSSNRILNVSPGSIKGTSFNGEKTDLSVVIPLAREIIAHMEKKDEIFIPQYDEVFKEVLERYHQNFQEEGDHSYDYKKKRLETL